MTAPPENDHNIPLAWPEIPTPVRRLLLHGSHGRDHLLAVVRQVLAQAAGHPTDAATLRRLLHLAQSVLLAAWADSPLDGSLAAMLLARPLPGWPSLPLPVSQLLQAQMNFWNPPKPEHAWWSEANHGARVALVRQGLTAEPKNLFWKLSAWDLAWPVADWSLVDETLVEATWPRTLASLRRLFAAQVFLARGDAHVALASLNAAPMLTTFVGDGRLRSECLLRLHSVVSPAVGASEAEQVLRRSLSHSPWRTSQWLSLHDLATATDKAVRPVPGDVAILLYTFNKARELDETLASLAASNIGEASVWVLDNGSGDDTPRVLSAWQKRLGERLTVLRLPVNIGAPAARNWLLSLPEVRRCAYLAFLDDDISLPEDWLLKLGTAVETFPEASVWGCRVVDEGNPLVVQSVDLTPLPPDAGDQPLLLPHLHPGQPDLGQFRYLRPCVSVTGCCHLLREADIDRTGGFDIRFSPTQFDDLERDLRLGLLGGHAAYQGHLCVRHKRRSGAAAERSVADVGNATANTHKLLTKYTAEDFVRLRESGEARLEADLRRKMERLGLKRD
jgi:GT2 family glycosyltransferase